MKTKSNMKICFVAIIWLFSVTCFSQEKKMARELSNTEKSIFTTVFSPFNSSHLILFKNGSYKFSFGSCLQSGEDSGLYVVTMDTINLYSVYKNVPIDRTAGHDQIYSLTGERFLKQTGRLIHIYNNTDVELMKEWLLEIYEQYKTIGLDSSGNGFLKVYNKDNFLIEEGEYKNYELYNGERYDTSKNQWFPKVKSIIFGGIEKIVREDKEIELEIE